MGFKFEDPPNPQTLNTEERKAPYRTETLLGRGQRPDRQAIDAVREQLLRKAHKIMPGPQWL